MSEVRTASLNPNDAVQGGLLDDADVVIREARFTLWNYNGAAKDTTALRVSMEDADGKQHEQYYSAGDPERFVPSDDGRKLYLTGTATALNASSNVVQFLKSLIDAGFPAAGLTDDIGAIDGLKAHVNRVTQQKRSFQGAAPDNGRERTILLVTKVIAMPGEKPKKGGAKAATVSVAPAVSAANGSEVSDEIADAAAQYLLEILAENGGSIERQKVSQLAFQKALKAKDARKSEITKAVFNEQFLRSREEFAFDGKVISMAA